MACREGCCALQSLMLEMLPYRDDGHTEFSEDLLQTLGMIPSLRYIRVERSRRYNDCAALPDMWHLGALEVRL